MTEIILKSSLDKKQKEALILLFKSWNVDAELKTSRTNMRKRKKAFSLSSGMWRDYHIEASEIRKQAWNRNK